MYKSNFYIGRVFPYSDPNINYILNLFALLELYMRKLKFIYLDKQACFPGVKKNVTSYWSGHVYVIILIWR